MYRDVLDVRRMPVYESPRIFTSVPYFIIFSVLFSADICPFLLLCPWVSPLHCGDHYFEAVGACIPCHNLESDVVLLISWDLAAGSRGETACAVIALKSEPQMERNKLATVFFLFSVSCMIHVVEPDGLAHRVSAGFVLPVMVVPKLLGWASHLPDFKLCANSPRRKGRLLLPLDLAMAFDPERRKARNNGKQEVPKTAKKPGKVKRAMSASSGVGEDAVLNFTDPQPQRARSKSPSKWTVNKTEVKGLEEAGVRNGQAGAKMQQQKKNHPQHGKQAETGPGQRNVPKQGKVAATAATGVFQQTKMPSKAKSDIYHAGTARSKSPTGNALPSGTSVNAFFKEEQTVTNRNAGDKVTRQGSSGPAPLPNITRGRPASSMWAELEKRGGLKGQSTGTTYTAGADPFPPAPVEALRAEVKEEAIPVAPPVKAKVALEEEWLERLGMKMSRPIARGRRMVRRAASYLGGLELEVKGGWEELRHRWVRRDMVENSLFCSLETSLGTAGGKFARNLRTAMLTPGNRVAIFIVDLDNVPQFLEEETLAMVDALPFSNVFAMCSMRGPPRVRVERLVEGRDDVALLWSAPTKDSTDAVCTVVAAKLDVIISMLGKTDDVQVVVLSKDMIFHQVAELLPDEGLTHATSIETMFGGLVGGLGGRKPLSARSEWGDEADMTALKFYEHLRSDPARMRRAGGGLDGMLEEFDEWAGEKGGDLFAIMAWLSERGMLQFDPRGSGMHFDFSPVPGAEGTPRIAPPAAGKERSEGAKRPSSGPALVRKGFFDDVEDEVGVGIEMLMSVYMRMWGLKSDKNTDLRKPRT